jgi:hypothetical protein
MLTLYNITYTVVRYKILYKTEQHYLHSGMYIKFKHNQLITSKLARI